MVFSTNGAELCINLHANELDRYLNDTQKFTQDES